MTSAPTDAIARVLSKNGAAVGAAFLVTGRRLVTCAHVVADAGASPGDIVRVTLHKTGRDLRAQVMRDGWAAPNKEDVALLQLLDDEPPPAVDAVRFASSAFAKGSVDTFGFPKLNNRDGLAGRCEIIGTTTLDEYPVLQVRAPEVVPGYSGAPAWIKDSGFVVGMVVSTVVSGPELLFKQRDTTFIIPSETIRRVCALELPRGCPYRGLNAFDEVHKGNFFGRDEAIKELIARIRATNLVIVAGVSGSGKSSLVRAGLVKGFDRYPIPGVTGRPRCVVKPSRTPVFDLLMGLASLEPSGADRVERTFELTAGTLRPSTSEVREALREKSPAEISAALRAYSHETGLLLVIDQFERLFTECSEAAIRTRFMDILSGAAGDDIKVILSIKADYSGAVLEHGGIAHFAGNGPMWLRPMEAEELHDAIVCPAAQLGRWFEPEVVNSLIDEVKDRPGDLPLLQFALTELWKKDEASGVLTLNSYNGLGFDSPDQHVSGARGAIVWRAEEIWKQFADRGKSAEVKRVFMALVLAADPAGATVIDASRRARLSEFADGTRQIAEELASSFLLTTGRDPFSSEPTVEVAHEALIRNWPRLRLWVEEYRPFLRWFTNEFSPYMQRWLDEERSDGFLLPPAMLHEAKSWAGKSPEFLSGSPAEFIEGSIGKYRRRRNLVWGGIIAVAGVALIAVVSVILSNAQAVRSRAQDLQERGVLSLADRDCQSAQVLLATALELKDTPETRQYFLEARAGGAIEQSAVQAPGEVIAVNTDGTRFAIRGRSERIEVRDLNGELVAETLFPAEGKGDGAAAFSKSGQLLAYASAKGDVSVWDLNAGTASTVPQVENGTLPACPAFPGGSSRSIASRDGEQPEMHSIAFSPDALRIAFGDADGIIQIVDLKRNSVVSRFCAHDQTVHAVAFSADGSLLASGGSDRKIRLWHSDGRLKQELGSHEDYVQALVFSEDGKFLSSGGMDGAVRIWDIATGNAQILTGHRGLVTAVAIHPTAHLVASASEDRTVRLWDTVIAKEIAVFKAQSKVTSAIFSPDGKYIIAGSDTGEIRIWDIGRSREGYSIYTTDPVSAVAFDPSGRHLAAASHNSVIWVWDLDTSQIKQLPRVHDGAIWALAFGPSGMLASAGEDRVIRIWDIDKGSLVQSLPGSSGQIYSLAFHPKQNLLASAEFAGTHNSKIHIWNTDVGKEIGAAPHPGGSVWVVAFSPDGNYLASGGGDASVRIWDVSDPSRPFEKTEVKSVSGNEIFGLAFNRDGTTLATAGIEQHIQLWRVPQLSLLREFPDLHDGAINALAISATADFLATASADNSVRLWNMDSANSAVLLGHERPVWAVAFDPSRELLASGGLDHRIIIWELAEVRRVLTADPAELLSEAQGDTCFQVQDEQVEFRPCQNVRAGISHVASSEAIWPSIVAAERALINSGANAIT